MSYKPSFAYTGLKQLLNQTNLPHTLQICIDRNTELTKQKRKYLLETIELKKRIKYLEYYNKYNIT